ncbi:MAG: pilin [Patescibacteria group bacterium]
MSTSKKLILFFAIASGVMLFTTLVFAASVSAADIGFGSGGMAADIASKAGYDTAQTSTSLSQTVGGIIRAVLSVIGVLFLGLTIFAGFMWMTASGNEDKVTKAKSILTSSVIGLVIVVASYGITALVFSFFFQATAPATDVSTGSAGDGEMGCCVSEDESKCGQTNTRSSCTTKSGWGNASWYAGESCTPYITLNTNCEIQNDL